MIELSLTKEQAIALLLLGNADCSLYGTEHVPARVVALRAVVAELDEKLDALVASEQTQN